MAQFKNYATLTYSGGTSNSNTVTGELLPVLAATKTAVMDDYTPKDSVTYVLSLVNTGAKALTGLTVTDDLGAYAFGGNTLYPLAYTNGSLRCYINGVLQTPAPTVTVGPPLVITNLHIPAEGNLLLIYEAAVTPYAPLGIDATITNTATITGGDLCRTVTATETIGMAVRPELSISKALCPATVTECGQITYTFVIENLGAVAASAGDNVVLTDTFTPILNPIAVTLNDVTWSEGNQYTYNPLTGQFATNLGKITVPAAAYTQKPDGTWAITPGTATLTITGTI